MFILFYTIYNFIHSLIEKRGKVNLQYLLTYAHFLMHEQIS